MHCGNALGPMLGHCAHLTRERMDARMSRFLFFYAARLAGGERRKKGAV